MSFVLGILTVLLVANCMLLILLVLVQLPKKDAGAGMAFGAGTADALFGAGSGNALTKITKYTAVVFLALSLFLGILQGKVRNDSSATQFTTQLEKTQAAAAAAPAPTPKPPAAPPAANNLLSAIPMVATNNLAAPTNAAK
jgi:preprotein translocase subunit SecG